MFVRKLCLQFVAFGSVIPVASLASTEGFGESNEEFERKNGVKVAIEDHGRLKPHIRVNPCIANIDGTNGVDSSVALVGRKAKRIPLVPAHLYTALAGEPSFRFGLAITMASRSCQGGTITHTSRSLST